MSVATLEAGDTRFGRRLTMGGFERHNNGTDATSAPTAAELRSTVEREVREILEGAGTKAAQISDLALERGDEMERESERKSREMLQAAAAQARELLDEVNALERQTDYAVSSFRERTEALVADLEQATAPPPNPKPGPPAQSGPEPAS
jgi:hypothetical protein